MTLPKTMRVVEIARPGGPEVLRPATRPVPVPPHDGILIRVAAAGVNRPDLAQREGRYPPPPDASDLPGLEAAGEVVAVGAGVTRWRPGDRVTALLPGGGYAEYAVTHADHALPWPDRLSATEAGAIPETLFTVWVNAVMRGGLKAGEVMLVHGGSSGIGTMAIQIGVALGVRVLVTVGSKAKAEACRKLGAERAILYREQDFVAETLAVTGGRGADLILDMVGGDYVARNIAAAAESGRIAQIATLAGAEAAVNVSTLMRKRLTLTGSTLRPRSVAEKAAIADSLAERIWPMVGAGRIAPVIDSTFPLDQAAAAHARLEDPAHVGKIVLIP